MYRTTVLVLALYLSSVVAISSQREKPASKTELDEITQRGKELAAYDVAAWRGSDAVVALSPEKGSVTCYVAKKTDKGWVVAFGHFNEAGDKFLITYQADQGSLPKEFKGSKIEPPREDSGFFFHAAKAIGTAKADFKGEQRAYNTAALPATSDQFYVYVLPAQTDNDVFPLGGDTRYLISADGSKIVEKHRMHISIIEFRKPSDVTVVKEGYHTAVLDEVPEDSDVFHVLSRTPSVPEWVVSKNFVYLIRIDGTINYVTTREMFTKIGKDRPGETKP
jgi:hypothetical protein